MSNLSVGRSFPNVIGRALIIRCYHDNKRIFQYGLYPFVRIEIIVCWDIYKTLPAGESVAINKKGSPYTGSTSTWNPAHVVFKKYLTEEG